MFSCLDVANVLLRDGKRSGKRILYHCTCGNHASGKEDKHRSLSIEPGKDWFYDGPNGGGTAWELLSLLTGIHASNKEEMITKAVSLGLIVESNNGNSITDIYDYEDRNGTLVYQVLRKTGKTFLQRRPDGSGGWIWKMDGVKRLPYRLPEISKPEIKDIFWVEGEKDADALAEIGLQATTSSGGAANLHHLPDATDQIPRHLNVTIIPDNDTPGREYANKVAAFLRGKVSSVKILELQNLPEKGDVSDWLAGKDPVEAAEQLCFMADNAPQPEPTEQTKAWREPVLWSIGEIDAWPDEPLDWILEGLIPKGSVGFLTGMPKDGKTLFALDHQIHNAHGRLFLGRFKTKSIKTLYIAREDPRRRIKERVLEINKSYGYPWPIPNMTTFLIRDRFSLTNKQWMEWLRRQVGEHGFEFLILDVLNRMIPELDENSAKDMQVLVDQFDVINRDLKLTIMAQDHNRKPMAALKASRGTADPSPLEMKGSVAKYGCADFMICMGRTEEERQLAVYCENKDSDVKPYFSVNVSPKDSGLPKFQYVGDYDRLGEARREKGYENNKKILECISALDWTDPKEVYEKLKDIMKPDTIRKKVTVMIGRGQILSQGETSTLKWKRALRHDEMMPEHAGVDGDNGYIDDN